LAGLGSAALLLPGFITACNEDPVVPIYSAGFNLATDTGILNFAYASAQFQYAFYQNITFAPFVGASTLEASSPTTSMFGRMSEQARLQALVYRSTVTSGRITDVMAFDFDSIDFRSRAPVYALATQIEDSTAGMYLDLLPRCTDPEVMLFLSKIASVAARRAATVRDFADIAAGNSNTAARTSFAPDALIPATTGLTPVVTVREYAAFVQPYAVTQLAVVGA